MAATRAGSYPARLNWDELRARPRAPDCAQALLKMRQTRSAFSRTSSFSRGNMPTKIPSVGLMLENACVNASSAPLSPIRPAAMILNAKQVFRVCRMTWYIRGGSLFR